MADEISREIAILRELMEIETTHNAALNTKAGMFSLREITDDIPKSDFSQRTSIILSSSEIKCSLSGLIPE